MNLKEIGEFGLIEKLSEGCIIRKSDVIRAIGDDAAVFLHPAGEAVLVTTDMLVERIHFLKNATSGFNLGYKALAVNLSDIAAMGASAREAFVSIAIPEDCSIEFIEDIYEGMKHLSADFQINLLGGDTTGSGRDLVINVVVVGAAPKDEILYRNGAKTGDVIFCTGYLGDSRAGCHLIVNEIEAESDEFKTLKNAHLIPRPCLLEGNFLARCGAVHAAIDISDGLSSDLSHILKQSRVGAKIYAEKIPISENLKTFCRKFDFDPVQFAVAGGEDYVLLFTTSSDQAETISKKYCTIFKVPLFEIGEINDSNQLELEFPNGKTKRIPTTGWDHFKKT
ncbi:MAG: thiamine-phosphate kinase [Desulfobacterales bacterium]